MNGLSLLSYAEEEKKLLSDKKSSNGRNNYMRHPKPPYSYLGMIALAIYHSKEKRLTLNRIYERLREMFPFFKGSYQGWRESVRHTLSYKPCFIKESKDRNSKSKCNYWAVDTTVLPVDAFKRQMSSSKSVDLEQFRLYLHDQLNVSPVPTVYHYPALSSLTSQPRKKQKICTDEINKVDKHETEINFSIRNILSVKAECNQTDKINGETETNENMHPRQKLTTTPSNDGNEDFITLPISSCPQLTAENLHRVCQDFEQSFRQICPTYDDDSWSSPSFQPDVANIHNPQTSYPYYQQSHLMYPTPSTPFGSNQFGFYPSAENSCQYEMAPHDVFCMQDMYLHHSQYYSHCDEFPLDLS